MSELDHERQFPHKHRTFLVGSIEDNERFLGGCPHAATLVAWDIQLESHVVAALPCRRWGCRWCGPRRVASLAARIERANPNRLITLTIDPRQHESPRAAYDASRRQVSELSKVVRKNAGEFEYVRVLEATKAGWPHYHLVARCPFIKQHWLSDVWSRLSGAPIVDIRMIHHGRNVFRYVMKYLAKQTAVPWTTRRIGFSRNFFDSTEHKKHYVHQWTEKHRYYKGVAQTLRDKFAGHYAAVLSPNLWQIIDRANVEEAPEYVS